MKETIITLLAICGVAGAAPLTLPGTDDFTWIAGSNASGIGTGASAEIIWKLAAAITAENIGNTDLTGWFGGTGQGYGQGSYDEIHITATNSFTFVSRSELNGEYVAVGVALPEAAESITLSFTTSANLGWSVWSYDGEVATELFGLTYQGEGGSVSETYDTATVNASQLFVLWTTIPTAMPVAVKQSP